MSSSHKPVCARILLKPGSAPKVREWAQYILEHQNEALETLQLEGVTLESVFLDSSGEKDVLVYYMRSESQDKAEAVAARSVASIESYHRQFKSETWESVTRLELLIDLDVNEIKPVT